MGVNFGERKRWRERHVLERIVRVGWHGTRGGGGEKGLKPDGRKGDGAVTGRKCDNGSNTSAASGGMSICIFLSLNESVGFKASLFNFRIVFCV